MALQDPDRVEGWSEDDVAPETGVTLAELVDALRREAESAESEWDRLRGYQEAARKFYEGKPFGNEVVGRSQIVLPDVQETIDYMVPSVLRTFVSGDRVVEFEATDEQDEAGADEATAAVGYSFMRQQDGYRVLHDWLTCGLLEKYGVTKTTMVDEERVTRQRVTITDPVELEGFQGEVEDAEDNGDGSYTLALKSETKIKRFVDETIPAEEFRYSARARHEDEADYLAHVSVKTRSDLVDMGFDREQAYKVPTYSSLPRDREDDYSEPDPESTTALQMVELREEYARIDMDGDGIAERVKTFRVENEVMKWADKENPHPIWGDLAIETVDEQPFSVFTPFPRPHRLVGYSLADKVMDIQLGRSMIARQLFDGMVQANMPRPIVETRAMDENTIDDLLSPIAGAPIRVASAGGVQPYATTFDVGKSLTVMEWMTGERESRTGITRLNQGLDADALNKTATGTAMMQAQGQQQEEFIARNFAEAFSRLMAKKYRLMRREGDPFKIKVDGQYKEVDPSKWPEDVNLSIRVGLGTGNKDKRVQARMAMVPIMQEGTAIGEVSPKQRFNFVDGLVRDLGIGQGDQFWKNPDAPPEIDPATGQPKVEQEQPDPEMEAAKAEQAREDAKLELERQKTAAQLEETRAQSEAKIQLMREEAAAKLELEDRKSAAEADMNMQRMQFEQAMAMRQLEFSERMAERKAETDAKAAETRLSVNRPGGDLDK